MGKSIFDPAIFDDAIFEAYWTKPGAVKLTLVSKQLKLTLVKE